MVKGVLMRRFGGEQWAEWLKANGVVALDEIDTRALTLHLRDAGAMRAAIVSDSRGLSRDDALVQVRAQPAMAGQALVAEVSTPTRTSRTRRVAFPSRSSTTAPSDRS